MDFDAVKLFLLYTVAAFVLVRPNELFNIFYLDESGAMFRFRVFYLFNEFMVL